VKLLVYRKKSHTDQYLNFSSHHPLKHKLAVIRTLLERCYSIVTEEDDRKKEEEHVAKALSKCGYLPLTIDRVKQDIVEKSLKDEAKKLKNTRGNHKGMVVVVLYVKGLSEAFARILKSHGIATANRPHRTLRNFVVHPKDKIKDEDKTELIYRVPCKNCFGSYVGETGRKFGLRIKEHKKEVDSFTAGTQTRASKARESSVTHKSAITRPCRGREPCHRLAQGKSGRQRGTATDQMDKRGTLDQEDTEVHESGCRILPTQPHNGTR